MSTTTPARPPMRRGPGSGGPFGGMGMPAEKSMNFGPSAKRLLARLSPHRAGVIIVIALSVVSVTLSVLGPKLLGEATNIIFSGIISKTLPTGVTQQQVIDQLRASGDNQKADFISGMTLTPGQGIDFSALQMVLGIVLLIYVLASVFSWLSSYLLNGIVQRTVYRLRADVEAKVNVLPLRYFDGMQRGELLSRVTNDVDNIGQSMQQTLSQVITSLLTVVGVLVMMFIISPVLALIALITIPLTLGITAVIAKRSQKLFVAQWTHTGALNGQIEEAYSGHALVKVFGRHREVESRFAEKNAELYEASFGAQFVSGIIMPAMMFVGNLVYVAIAVVGGLFVSNGTMSLGDVQAFIQYSRQFTQPLSQLGSMANLLQSGVASAERVFELLDAPEQSPDPEGSETQALGEYGGASGRLAFENVSFRYEPEKPLIDDLSLVAEPGQTIAIVGPTGAGKTTLVNLMMRFYEIDSGRITLDGVDIATMSRDALRSRMGMVLQDTWLFSGSIMENIRYGRPDTTDDEVKAAAKAAFAHEFITALPEGYDTYLGERGVRLSGGQRQRISIARAMLKNPPLLLLDEATSALDAESERVVQQALEAAMADRTTIVIAHRLATVLKADRIVVLDGGRIVDIGTHHELVGRGGLYARLASMQFDLQPAA